MIATASARTLGSEIFGPLAGQDGQADSVAIQEIVEQLMADPETAWSRYEIEAPCQHLNGINNVTMLTHDLARDIVGGLRFEATSEDYAVTTSIRTRAPAHAATINGAAAWTMRTNILGGAVSTFNSEDPVHIRALGFICVMTVGIYLPAYQLALAMGESPHAR